MRHRYLLFRHNFVRSMRNFEDIIVRTIVRTIKGTLVKYLFKLMYLMKPVDRHLNTFPLSP